MCCTYSPSVPCACACARGRECVVCHGSVSAVLCQLPSLPVTLGPTHPLSHFCLPINSLPPSLFLPSLPISSLPSSDLSFSIPLPRPLLLSLSIPTSIGPLPYLLLSPISAIRQVGSFRLGDGKVRLRFHSQDPSPPARTCAHSLPKLLEIPGPNPCGKRNLQGEGEGTD